MHKVRVLGFGQISGQKIIQISAESQRKKVGLRPTLWERLFGILFCLQQFQMALYYFIFHHGERAQNTQLCERKMKKGVKNHCKIKFQTLP